MKMINDAAATIVHVPHASRSIPLNLRRDFLLDDTELERELDVLTDHYTDKLFFDPESTAAQLAFPVSRFVVDPERWEDDAMEPMAAKGMGVLYTRTTGGRQLRLAPPPMERQSLLNRYYRPHHRALERLVDAALARHGRALVIDGHSFPSQPLPCDLDQSPERPDICIGTDSVHTPGPVVDAITEQCARAGWSVAVNAPYAGTLVPTRFHGNDTRVASVMIEVNRRLYLADEPRDIKPGARFESVCRTVRGFVECASGACREIFPSNV
jgi:N-formylglutamate deformylase